jgi:Replication-relaxation
VGVTAEELVEQLEKHRENESRPVVLTGRDRELFVHLAISRYLTLEQIGRLIFPGKTASIAPRRLRRLANGKYQYVRRLPFRTKDGMALAWTLKPLGYLVARNHFHATPEPPALELPSAEFLEHDMLLNELYVSLAAAAKQKKLPFDRWPFRWLASDSARLPWTEFDREANSPASRLICPDATLELLQAQRRVFIELETGTHTLGFRDGVAGRNATKTKIERYASFIAAPASGGGDSFYLQTFPDGWHAELLFVVPSATRRSAIKEFVANGSVNDAPRFTVRAMTADEAPADLCRAAQLMAPSATPAPRVAGPGLSRDEIRALYDFYNAAIAGIAAVRQFAKSHPHLATQLPVPEYPANHEVVKRLCARIGGVTR